MPPQDHVVKFAGRAFDVLKSRETGAGEYVRLVPVPLGAAAETVQVRWFRFRFSPTKMLLTITRGWMFQVRQDGISSVCVGSGAAAESYVVAPGSAAVGRPVVELIQ